MREFQGADVGRPAGGGNRGARDAGGACTRTDRDSGDFGPDRVSLSRQGCDEGGPPWRRGADGGVGRDIERRGSRGIHRSGGVSGDPEATRGGRGVRDLSCRGSGEFASVARECGLADGAPVAIEEFVEGHEGFYDTLTVRGEVALDFVSHYYPNVLEAMRTRWNFTADRGDQPNGFGCVRRGAGDGAAGERGARG